MRHSVDGCRVAGMCLSNTPSLAQDGADRHPGGHVRSNARSTRLRKNRSSEASPSEIMRGLPPRSVPGHAVSSLHCTTPPTFRLYLAVRATKSRVNCQSGGSRPRLAAETAITGFAGRSVKLSATGECHFSPVCVCARNATQSIGSRHGAEPRVFPAVDARNRPQCR